MLSRKLRFALICFALLFSSINSIQAAPPPPDDTKPLYFDATQVERFGSISVLASQKVYTVSKGHHNEQERDKEGNHILRSIELELQIGWKARKVVENKEDINVYTLNSAGEFVLTKTIKYGTDVELTPYEYLEEDVQRYKGLPDPNFKLSEYTKYAKGKKAPAFRLRVQDAFREFIINNPDLVNAIEDLAKKYGYGNFELSYFNSVETKESNNFTAEQQKSNNLLKNLVKKSFWKDVYVSPKSENKFKFSWNPADYKGNLIPVLGSAPAKFLVGAGTYFGVYFYNSGGKIAENFSDHPASVITFTVLLTGWTFGKELMYSWSVLMK